MSTGRMETIEPPESTSGATGSEASEPQLPAPDAAEPDPGEPEIPDPEAPEPEGVEPTDAEPEAEVAADAEPAPEATPIPEADAEPVLEMPEAPEPEEVVAPPVVAVVVTSGEAPLLEATIASLAAQDYPALSVLVIDNATDVDPTARIAAALPTAFVRRLPENLGFAGAANDALRSVEGATFLLFCHDDVALDPDAVRVMVEEAYRSNAGHRRSEARRLRPTRDPARGRHVGRPLRQCRSR